MRKIARLKNLDGDTIYPVTVIQAVKGLPNVTESNYIYIDDTDEVPSTNPSDFASCTLGDVYIYQEDESNQKVYMLTYIIYQNDEPHLLVWKPLDGGSEIDPVALANNSSFYEALASNTSFISSMASNEGLLPNALLDNSSFIESLGRDSIFIHSLVDCVHFTSEFLANGTLLRSIYEDAATNQYFKNEILSNSSLMSGIATNTYFSSALLMNSSLMSYIATNSYFTNGENRALFEAVGKNPYFKDEFLSNSSLIKAIAMQSVFAQSLLSNAILTSGLPGITYFTSTLGVESNFGSVFATNSKFASTFAYNTTFFNSLVYNSYFYDRMASNFTFAQKLLSYNAGYLSDASGASSGFVRALNGVSDWQTIQTVNKGNSGDYIIDFSGLNLTNYKAIRIVFNAQCNESSVQTISIDLKHGNNTMTMYTSGSFITGNPHIYEIIIEEDNIPKLFNGVDAPFKISCKNYSGQYGYGYETVNGGRAFSGTKANSLGNVTGIEFKKAYKTWTGEDVWVILQGKAVK